MIPIVLTEGARDIILKGLDRYRLECIEHIESKTAEVSVEYERTWQEEHDRVVGIMMSIGAL